MKLFDFLFGKAMERRMAAYQNDLIRKHCSEVENMYRQVRGWRHDYHNHIQTMLALVDKPEQMRAYLLTLNEDLTTVDTVIKTGNVMLDAVLNSKLSLIKTKNIAVNAKAVVPEKLSISDVDLCVIIGNLLDNAMEACERQEETSERFIRVFIGVHQFTTF
ncbi:MAG: GHKL domain-containing protein [Lachnospiraceae bacterium]|nr:GHKL domain-containing protein [Lachnospiraceae bacterium]